MVEIISVASVKSVVDSDATQFPSCVPHFLST